jgi:hypothetical protein
VEERRGERRDGTLNHDFDSTKSAARFAGNSGQQTPVVLIDDHIASAGTLSVPSFSNVCDKAASKPR